MPKIIVVYATKGGETLKLAELIAEELRSLNMDVKLVDASDIKTTRDLFGYDAYVFGSPTYFGEMTESMKDVLLMAEKSELTGKAGATFGAYGWSGEAPKRIHDTITYVFRMNTIREPLMVSSGASKIASKSIPIFCKELAAKIK